jgi:hypothetical protein
MLGRGSPRIAFVVGLLLSFPGVSYLTALTHILERFRAWLARNGRQAGAIVAGVLGALVLIRGIASLVS